MHKHPPNCKKSYSARNIEKQTRDVWSQRREISRPEMRDTQLKSGPFLSTIDVATSIAQGLRRKYGRYSMSALFIQPSFTCETYATPRNGVLDTAFSSGIVRTHSCTEIDFLQATTIRKMWQTIWTTQLETFDFTRQFTSPGE